MKFISMPPRRSESSYTGYGVISDESIGYVVTDEKTGEAYSVGNDAEVRSEGAVGKRIEFYIPGPGAEANFMGIAPDQDVKPLEKPKSPQELLRRKYGDDNVISDDLIQKHEIKEWQLDYDGINAPEASIFGDTSRVVGKAYKFNDEWVITILNYGRGTVAAKIGSNANLDKEDIQ